MKILVRSSSESRRDSVCSSLESVFALAGAKVEESGHYNGWQPNINSPILNLMKSTYLDLFGKEPEVKVMHAGLECGISKVLIRIWIWFLSDRIWNIRTHRTSE